MKKRGKGEKNDEHRAKVPQERPAAGRRRDTARIKKNPQEQLQMEQNKSRGRVSKRRKG
jgi:hypothetical protein